MTEITHHQARTLLQTAADRPLRTDEEVALGAHIAICRECSNYAAQLSRLESNLRTTLHARWDMYRPVLDLKAIKNPPPANPILILFNQTSTLAKVTAMAALLFGYFLIANIVGIQIPVSNNQTPTTLPTPSKPASTFTDSPTPSSLPNALQMTSLSCETISYIVQVNDTLESIAVRYGITKEDILEYNKDQDSLFANMVFTGMELRIPICRSTPSFTASIPANTLTITPVDVTVQTDQPE